MASTGDRHVPSGELDRNLTDDELRGIDGERDRVLGDWPRTGPLNPESVLPSHAELRALAPSSKAIAALRKRQKKEGQE